MKWTTLSRWIAVVVAAVVLPQCAPASKPGLPPGSPFAPERLQADDATVQGVAAGDVTGWSAVIWFRTNGPATVEVEWAAEKDKAARSTVQTVKEHDFTAKVLVEGLIPDTRYEYSIVTARHDGVQHTSAPVPARGTFVTAPSDEHSGVQRFLWSGDLGGQKRCRLTASGYPIFDVMLRRAPAFAVLLGDLIYSDNRCPSPPNVPGSDFIAASLDGYRAKHRYQLEDLSLQRFLAAVPVYAMWDDHEVRNNFSGPHEPLMPAGRRALLEYWPIGTPPEEPFRLYRKFRRGMDLEMFLLDTRQYRNPNAEQDGPHKTMLGSAQREWLIGELARSTATWKIIVTSVPLSNQKGGTLEVPGNDSWARGGDGTGFQTELATIVRTILDRRIHNVVWLAGDVHYAQVNAYDPDGDGVTDFHEFICGPLSAAHGLPVAPNADWRPTTVYSAGGFSNFGEVTVDGPSLHLAIVDESGAVRFEDTISARRSREEPLAMDVRRRVP